MKKSLSLKLEQLARRLEELNAMLSSEQATSDMDEYRKLSREHAEITPVVERYRDYRAALGDAQAAKEMLIDAEMRVFGQSELESAQARMDEIELDLQKLLLPNLLQRRRRPFAFH